MPRAQMNLAKLCGVPTYHTLSIADSFSLKLNLKSLAYSRGVSDCCYGAAASWGSAAFQLLPAVRMKKRLVSLNEDVAPAHLIEYTAATFSTEAGATVDERTGSSRNRHDSPSIHLAMADAVCDAL